MNVQVLAPGLLSTLQDLGRSGSRHLGVGLAGALDRFSHTVANRLVGNAAQATTLEITLAGPRLRFERAASIALCGAPIEAHVDGQAIPGWRPVALPAGSELVVGRCRQGARAYLAIHGGFAVPQLLGSASTDLRGGFGGMRGRALARGDVLQTGTDATDEIDTSRIDTLQVAPWWIDPAPVLDFDIATVVHVLPGRDASDGNNALCKQPWRVAAASNRQGLRLEGAPVHRDQPSAASSPRISEPVAVGTIQLPPDGQPIVLLADAQTHGGYPCIGHAIVAHWPRLAQLRPGDTLRFMPCTPAQARQLRRQLDQQLARIDLAIDNRRQTP